MLTATYVVGSTDGADGPSVHRAVRLSCLCAPLHGLPGVTLADAQDLPPKHKIDCWAQGYFVKTLIPVISAS